MRPYFLLPAMILGFFTAMPLVFSQEPPPAPPQPKYKPWGPSWVGGGPPGGNQRPEKLKADLIRSTVSNVGSPLGVEIGMWCDVADLKMGNKYQLMYQCRLHTKKGEGGVLLGDTLQPKSRAYLIDVATADVGWNGLEGTFDFTRRDLSTMTNLPKVEKGIQTAFIRVEPQIFDVTAGKFITPSKTEAIIAVAVLGEKGRVLSVNTLAEWIETNRDNATVDMCMTKLADLDSYSPSENGVGIAIQRVLAMKNVSTKVKAKMIPAIPDIAFSLKENYGLAALLEELAKSDDPALKSAAEVRLKQVAR